MQQYMPKLHVVEAVQWDGTERQAQEICKGHGYVMRYKETTDKSVKWIEVDGSRDAEQGDWIVFHPNSVFREVVSAVNFPLMFNPA